MIVRISGGLGNQMFQYAFATFLKEKGYSVTLDVNDFNRQEYHHGYELKKIFPITAEYSDIQEVKKIAYYKQGNLCKVYRKVFNRELRKKSEITVYNSSVKYDDKSYFDGIWQDPYYAESIKEKLKKEFKFKLGSNNTNEFNQIKNNIVNSESISVHVRRGDYVNNKKLGGVIQNNYYREGIKEVIDKIGNEINLYIFSDDLDWCREEFSHLPYDITYVDINYGANSFLDMYLMSLCKHNVISNSTFSWWGAWLNKNPDKVVVCPEKWDVTGRDLALSSWMKL